MDKTIEYIKKAFAYIVNLVRKVINGIINFAKNIVNWFKTLNLVQKRDVPFLANANSLEFQKMLKTAPVKDVGIFKGVYNEETNEITHHEFVEADGLDQETKDVLGNENLVVLQ